MYRIQTKAKTRSHRPSSIQHYTSKSKATKLLPVDTLK
jgi:hypothetical protein